MLTVATMPDLSAQGVAVGERRGVGVDVGGRGKGAVAVGVSGVGVRVGRGVSDGPGVGPSGGSPVAAACAPPSTRGATARPLALRSAELPATELSGVSAMAAWTTGGVATHDNERGAQAARLAHMMQPMTR